MSKVGRKPIEIPEGVTAEFKDDTAVIKGKLGELTVPILPWVKFAMADGVIQLTIVNERKQTRSNWGTTAAHLRNAIIGVTEGYKKELEIHGVGFKAALEGETINLSLGFSHPVIYKIPEGIKAEVDKNKIVVSGIDKTLVGQTAAEIRKYKKPEPYQGKGIRYVGEKVRRKAGKKVAGSA